MGWHTPVIQALWRKAAGRLWIPVYLEQFISKFKRALGMMLSAKTLGSIPNTLKKCSDVSVYNFDTLKNVNVIEKSQWLQKIQNFVSLSVPHRNGRKIIIIWEEGMEWEPPWPLEGGLWLIPASASGLCWPPSLPSLTTASLLRPSENPPSFHVHISYFLHPSWSRDRIVHSGGIQKIPDWMNDW